MSSVLDILLRANKWLYFDNKRGYMSEQGSNYFFDLFLYFINGPVILLVVLTGLILNTNTIIVLAKKIAGREPSSCRVVSMITKQFVGLIRMGSSDSLFGRVCNYIAPKKRGPKIYIYFLWLTCTDTVLLISSFFMYSVPILFGCYDSIYAYLIPFWYVFY